MRLASVLAVAMSALVVAACGSDATLGPAAQGPHVDAFDRNEIMIGQTLLIVGQNFSGPFGPEDSRSGSTRIDFNGVFEFVDRNGQTQVQPTTFRIRPLYDGVTERAETIGNVSVDADTAVLRYSRFGPFQNPFQLDDDPLTRNNNPGTFRGTVTATNEYLDGTTETDPHPTELTLKVLPSIIIKRLVPVVDMDANGNPVPAACKTPSPRVLAGMPYILEVEAMGFEPTSITYDVSNANAGRDLNGTGWTRYTHSVAEGAGSDFIGTPEEPLVFNPLGEREEMSFSTIYVQATDSEGNQHFTAYPVPVVLPVQLISDGQLRLAEIYPAVPASGAVVGGIGSAVSYTRNNTTARQRGAAMTYGTQESVSQGISNMTNFSRAINTTNSISEVLSEGRSTSEARTSGESYGESMGTSTATTDLTTTTNGTTFGENESSTNTSVESNYDTGFNFGYDFGGFKVGSDFGSEWTDTNSRTNGTSSTRSDSTSRTFGTIGVIVRGESFGQTFGLARQSAINQSTSRSEASSESVAIVRGGGQSTTRGTVTGSTEAWNESFVDVSSNTTVLGYSSVVPRAQCGVMYIQNFRFIRQAELVVRDICGLETMIGKLDFNEWDWAPSIALSDGNCSDGLPPPATPTPQCMLGCE